MSGMDLNAIGMLKYERNWEEDPYWHSNKFWKKFLSNSIFDHAYFVDIFKVFIGDCEFRNNVLQHFLGGKKLLYNIYAPDETENQRFKAITTCIKTANRKKQKAYLTWEYPPIIDDEDEQESHIVMYIYDPVKLEVVSVDSRGKRFARNYCTIWTKSFMRMKELFKKCIWIDAVEEDLQISNKNDHFCQTWSLLLVISIETLRSEKSITNKTNTDEYNSETTSETLSEKDDLYSLPLQFNPQSLTAGYTEIIQFWRQIVRIPKFREHIYYETYRQTHSITGKTRYNRYFSTLEALVNCSNTVYYPSQVQYKDTGYTFIEEFVDIIDETTLEMILE